MYNSAAVGRTAEARRAAAGDGLIAGESAAAQDECAVDAGDGTSLDVAPLPGQPDGAVASENAVGDGIGTGRIR